MNTQRVTLPTKSLLQGCTYRPWWNTDVRITFAIFQARLMLEKKK